MMSSGGSGVWVSEEDDSWARRMKTRDTRSGMCHLFVTAYRSGGTMRMLQISGGTSAHSLPLRRWSITPLILTVCWVLFQKGCVFTPDISPARTLSDLPAWPTMPVPALPVGDQSGEHHVPHGVPGSSNTGNPSLKQVSTLLRQAATMIDNNDRTALRLILQAVTILKQEIMRGSAEYDYDRISTKQPPITAPLAEAGADQSFRAPSVLKATTVRTRSWASDAPINH